MANSRGVMLGFIHKDLQKHYLVTISDCLTWLTIYTTEQVKTNWRKFTSMGGTAFSPGTHQF